MKPYYAAVFQVASAFTSIKTSHEREVKKKRAYFIAQLWLREDNGFFKYPRMLFLEQPTLAASTAACTALYYACLHNEHSCL